MRVPSLPSPSRSLRAAFTLTARTPPEPFSGLVPRSHGRRGRASPDRSRGGRRRARTGRSDGRGVGAPQDVAVPEVTAQPGWRLGGAHEVGQPQADATAGDRGTGPVEADLDPQLPPLAAARHHPRSPDDTGSHPALGAYRQSPPMVSSRTTLRPMASETHSTCSRRITDSGPLSAHALHCSSRTSPYAETSTQAGTRARHSRQHAHQSPEPSQQLLPSSRHNSSSHQLVSKVTPRNPGVRADRPSTPVTPPRPPRPAARPC